MAGVMVDTLRSHGYQMVSELHRSRRNDMKRVLKAEELPSGSRCAIKVIPKVLVATEQKMRRLRDKKRMLAQVQSAFVEKLLGTFQDADRLYMVMDLVDGTTLWDIVRIQQRLCTEGAKFAVAAVACALAAMNERSFCHRDVKVTNVVCDTQRGRIVLIDSDSCAEIPPGSERRRSLVGTKHCMAPEVICEEGHGLECDWWSLGVMMYELLVGTQPFWEGGGEERSSSMLDQIRGAEVDYPGSLHPDAEDVMQRLMCVPYKERLATLQALKESALFSEEPVFPWGWLEEGSVKFPPSLSTRRVDFRDYVISPGRPQEYEQRGGGEGGAGGEAGEGAGAAGDDFDQFDSITEEGAEAEHEAAPEEVRCRIPVAEE